MDAHHSKALTDPDWKVLPWKFFGVLVVHGMLIGFLGRQSEVLGIVASLISSLLLPATLMVLIQSFSLRAALSPFELLATMTAIGAQYLLLCLFLFLLQQARGILLPITPRALLLPVGVFAAVYFLWVMASLIGYVMYQHHGALEIDLLREPEPDAASAAARPVKTEAQVRDAEVSALVQKSDLKEAASGVLA